jgi:glycosyltransferase involved in cell wall biosynthesis
VSKIADAALKFPELQNNIFLIVVDDGSSDGSTAFIENKYPA